VAGGLQVGQVHQEFVGHGGGGRGFDRALFVSF
jgi:hypothetical protein